MTINLDNTIVTIACPQCGKKLQEKIGRMKRDKRIDCPSCGKIAVDTSQLVAVEKSINDELAKLGGSIKLKL